MAGIDKTYLKGFQYKEAIKWIKENPTVTYENGITENILPYIGIIPNEEEIDNNRIYILWSTPEYMDRWLYMNCPLSFIKERIEEQYSKETLEIFKNYKYIPEEINYSNKFSIKVFDRKYINSYCSVRVLDENYNEVYYDEFSNKYTYGEFLQPVYFNHLGIHFKGKPKLRKIRRWLRNNKFQKGWTISIESVKYQVTYYKVKCL